MNIDADLELLTKLNSNWMIEIIIKYKAVKLTKGNRRKSR